MVRYAKLKSIWYQAHGIGAKEYKIKRILEDTKNRNRLEQRI